MTTTATAGTDATLWPRAGRRRPHSPVQRSETSTHNFPTAIAGMLAHTMRAAFLGCGAPPICSACRPSRGPRTAPGIPSVGTVRFRQARTRPDRGARGTRVLAAIMFTVAATAACGGTDAPDPGESSTASPKETAVDDVLAAKLTLPGDPDWLAADEHGLWVQRASGELTLIDPTTNEVAGSVDVGQTELCSGIGAAYGAVWTCVGSDVARVDPTTFEVVARLPVNKQAVQGHLVGGFDRVWVLTSDGSNLVGIDPATNEVAAEFKLPARCSDVTLAEDALWLPCDIDDRVLKLDPTSGKVLLDLPVDNPASIAVDTDVWVGTSTSTVQVDPGTGDVLVEAAIGTEGDGAVALDADTVWVRNRTSFLARLDRETGEIVEQINAGDLTSGGDLLVLDGAVWTTAYDDQLLFRIDPTTA